jgi:hypothetical protein
MTTASLAPESRTSNLPTGENVERSMRWHKEANRRRQRLW